MTSAQTTHNARSSANLRTLTLRAFLLGLRENMVRAIWQPFVLSLGASMPLLGLLESIGGFGGIVSTAMLPLGGWLSDRRGRKVFVVLASVFCLAASSVFALAGWTHAWRWLLPGVVLLGLAAIARPAIDSLTAESATPGARGSAFGLTSTFFAISGVLAPALGGLLAQRFGFLTVLLVGVAMEAATLGLLAVVLRESLPPGKRPQLVLSDFVSMLKRIMTPPVRLRSFYLAVTIDAFAFGMGATILFGMLSKSYRFTPLHLGLMSSASSVTWAVSQLFFGQQVDQRGCVPFLILSETISVVVLVGWLLARSPVAFIALHGLWGLAVATWMPAYLAWISNNVSEKQRAEEMGRLGAFKGLLSFPAPYLGGLLYNAFGFRGPILANLVGAVVVVMIMWRFVREPMQPLD